MSFNKLELEVQNVKFSTQENGPPFFFLLANLYLDFSISQEEFLLTSHSKQQYFVAPMPFFNSEIDVIVNCLPSILLTCTVKQKGRTKCASNIKLFMWLRSDSDQHAQDAPQLRVHWLTQHDFNKQFYVTECKIRKESFVDLQLQVLRGKTEMEMAFLQVVECVQLS